MARAQVGEWSPYDGAGRRKYTSSGERRRFLEVADSFEPEQRALLCVLAFAGCRVSEALELTRDRVDRETGTLIFRTLKRRKLIYRAVPVPAFLIGILLSLPIRNDEKLWTMHRTTAWRYVKRAMEEARIEGPMSCGRGLRHGFGILAASEKVPPNLIQKWLGHASVVTTAIYLDAVGQEERRFAKRTWR